MIQEHWLFYRVATNVLFDPGHIYLAIFYSYDTVKGVIADFKVIFETQTSFKILVKREKKNTFSEKGTSLKFCISNRKV